MTSKAAFIAAHRFGLGPRPGELKTIAKDPQGWVAAQIGPVPLPKSFERFPSSEEITTKLSLSGQETRKTFKQELRKQQRAEDLETMRVKVTTNRPFAERMVAFWANHFSVTAGRAMTKDLVHAYEREAIRPYVFGSFNELAFSAITHPGMVEYLDNGNSFGPNSPIGKRRKAKINENLARETLELYTLGVNGGYTQEDVEELAKILTGWGLMSPQMARVKNRFADKFPNQEFSRRIGYGEYFPLVHEPGPKTVLGKTYEEEGPQELRRVVDDLAAHPSTATFIATKLCRHFVDDNPPLIAVNKIANVFMQTNGDLAQVSLALVQLEEAWLEPLPKAKSPHDFAVATFRALQADNAEAPILLPGMNIMGQKLHSAPSPQGWPDEETAWFNPASLMRRIEWSRQISKKLGKGWNPRNVLEQTIGPVASEEIRQVVRGAPSSTDAIAFVLASREFQRR
ncbi:DUF1800 domain-containing protein [Parvularcula lutaonensis]|uniref:DUF1800 family protein n=1 Tax=Parvularcula lutaonensis TaxID=491923 RepID=A0ABV7MEK0_9PROT|nr:DUF1800 domain-containing protein [Parvularcula lutaonensis]GGY55679.1 hypothetical protein GCM10007148_26980 [Parvularcula lutaonensis]